MTALAIGRFLIPADHPHARTYFFSHLHAPYGFRDRLRASLRARRPVPTRPTVAPEIAELLGDLRVAAEETAFILDRDYAHNPRGRSLFFVFDRHRHPRYVIKARPISDAASLSREHDTLRRLRAQLPGSLAATIPEPVAFRTLASTAALVTTAVPGRSIYVDVHQRFTGRSLRPHHWEAAADWLSAFHRAVAKPTRRHSPSHGDFWTRNVLLQPARHSVSGVVDWEQYRDDDVAGADAFHFAVTAALTHAPSRMSDQRSLERAFVLQTRLSASVARFLARYARGVGIDPRHLPPLFEEFLVSRRHQNGVPWRTCLTLIRSAGRSARSG